MSFRRLITARVAVTLLLLSVVATPALADPAVAILPAAGAQADTFTVGGTGLQPGIALDINFTSPEGKVYSTAALNQVVVVDGDGNLSFGFVPQTEFVGASFGTWTAQVCVSGTDLRSGRVQYQRIKAVGEAFVLGDRVQHGETDAQRLLKARGLHGRDGTQRGRTAAAAQRYH